MWETHFQMDNMSLLDIHLQFFHPWVYLFWNHYGKRILQRNLLMVLQVLQLHRTFSLGKSEVVSFLLDNRSHSDISLHLSQVWLLLFLHCRSIQDHTDQSHSIDLECKYHSYSHISAYFTIGLWWHASVVLWMHGRLLRMNACLITLMLQYLQKYSPMDSLHHQCASITYWSMLMI